ncbi:formyltetrahydrofolate-dependent phosphoribosylglycinamide formyltransferase [Desulfobotulus alkaliphilus]|uniref:Phosphoribosylglycinamide formyltransferase n=1 Tax=Desulfobotulus alkaliphilus TaxID=622671 RepID=A0A562S8P0_9BACT|nr:phosphoribosylglycinamide formyltransferase [Desulfobotulus alkaliphilus]TWI76796.1 formyltetrahydrofolate-dependent phosphoribosylglycinamide formyltransferase [Desulfobotulus alkaliphilus]
MKKKLALAILLSGGGSNAQAIMDACRSGALDAKVRIVGADRLSAGGLDRAAAMGVDHFVVDYKGILQDTEASSVYPPPPDLDLGDVLKKQHLFPEDRASEEGCVSEKVRHFFMRRAAAERMLLDALLPFEPDLIVLAGFMRTLSPYFIDRMQQPGELPKIMNIHPALLPAFPGTDGYGDTFRHGCRVGGCTVHFVDYGEDSGPIVGQAAFPILPGDSLEDVKRRGLEEEWKLYPSCIQLYAEGRLVLENRPQRSGAVRRVVRVLS